MKWVEHTRFRDMPIWRAEIATFTLCVDRTHLGWRYRIADHTGAFAGFKSLEAAQQGAVLALEAKLDEWLDEVRQAIKTGEP